RAPAVAVAGPVFAPLTSATGGNRVSTVSNVVGCRLPKFQVPARPSLGVGRTRVTCGLVVPARLTLSVSPGLAGGFGSLPWMVKATVALGVPLKVSPPLPPLALRGVLPPDGLRLNRSPPSPALTLTELPVIAPLTVMVAAALPAPPVRLTPAGVCTAWPAGSV